MQGMMCGAGCAWSCAPRPHRFARICAAFKKLHFLGVCCVPQNWTTADYIQAQRVRARADVHFKRALSVRPQAAVLHMRCLNCCLMPLPTVVLCSRAGGPHLPLLTTEPGIVPCMRHCIYYVCHSMCV